jgi:hypothetical protein
MQLLGHVFFSEHLQCHEKDPLALSCCSAVLPMQLIKNGLTIREAKVHMKTHKSSHYDPMNASTPEPYACIKGVKLQLKQQSHYCFGLLANMELPLGYGNSMGNTT